MENKIKIFTILISLSLFMTSLALAEKYSIDISGLKSEEYTPGEEINFKVILLEGENIINKEVDIQANDILNKNRISQKAISNQETSIKVENNFSSGIWVITAKYLNSTVERNFLVKENSKIEFLIENDELIIRNKGNIRYTKTIKITIGGKAKSYSQNIGVGDEKILKLISPKGTYNIEVSDGQNSIKRENVQLFGTGNVVGAVDKNLVGYTGFAGANDIDSIDERFISLDKLPVALVFIIAVGILAALVFVERKISRAQ